MSSDKLGRRIYSQWERDRACPISPFSFGVKRDWSPANGLCVVTGVSREEKTLGPSCTGNSF